MPATEADGGRSRAASGDAAVLRASRQDIAAPCARDAKRRADTPRPPLGPPARAEVCVSEAGSRKSRCNGPQLGSIGEDRDVEASVRWCAEPFFTLRLRRSRRPNMCYRTECGKCGKPTWVSETRRHPSRRPRPDPRASGLDHVFHLVCAYLSPRDSPLPSSSFPIRLAEACTSSRRSAACPRRTAAPAREVRRLPAP